MSFFLKKRSNVYKVEDKIDEDKIDEDKIDEDKIIEVDDNVILFVKYLFTFLKKNNMCFLSGTIIFQDNNNELFNFLTFNDTANNSCNGKVKSTNAHITTTHKKVYDKDKVESAEKCVENFLSDNILKRKLESLCGKHFCFKMEYVFNNKINFLCDQETKRKSINPKNKSTKRVILYYRFKILDKTYLFFKLEEHSMENPKHLLTLVNTKRIDTYPKRRENIKENIYIHHLIHIDNSFYDKQLKDLPEKDKQPIYDEINFYNIHLRTGHELFIYEDLKKNLLNYKAVKLEEIGISF